MKKIFLLTFFIISFSILNSFAQSLQPFSWKDHSIQFSLPGTFEPEEISFENIYGFTSEHEYSIYHITDKAILNIDNAIHLKNECKRFGFVKLPLIQDFLSPQYQIKYCFGKTHGLGDMFLAMIIQNSTQKTYILNISMGISPEKIGLEVLKNLK